MPSFAPHLRRNRDRDQAYASVASVAASDEGKPLQDPDAFDYETPDGDLHALRKQIRRNSLYLRILLGLVAFVAIGQLISPVSQVVQDYSLPASSSNAPLLKTPVPPRKLLDYIR